MLFDFHKFIEELRKNDEKSEMLTEYERLFPSDLKKSLLQQTWYKDYVCKFEVIEYNLPHESKDDFDWKLLMQLALASFSSETKLYFEANQLPDFEIFVENDEKYISKLVSELSKLQLLRMYEIYIEEQINFAIHHKSDEFEKKEIDAQRKHRLDRWNRYLKYEYKSALELEEIFA